MPTAYFKDEEGGTLEEVVLSDLDHEEILNFFALHGLTPKKPKVEFNEPLITWDYQNHHYEFFDVKATYKDANEFALSRQYNDLTGYPLTLTSAEEEATVVKHLSNENEPRDIWLGAEDQAEEGIWKWTVGPEAGVKFWQGKGTQGNSLDGQYQHWREHEPNNANDINDEDCAIISVQSGTSLWNDLPCRSKAALVVEYGENLLPVEKGADRSHEDL